MTKRSLVTFLVLLLPVVLLAQATGAQLDLPPQAAPGAFMTARVTVVFAQPGAYRIKATVFEDDTLGDTLKGTESTICRVLAPGTTCVLEIPVVMEDDWGWHAEFYANVEVDGLRFQTNVEEVREVGATPLAEIVEDFLTIVIPLLGTYLSED